MRAALVALFLFPAAALAQGLQDAVPDCKLGARLVQQCRHDCDGLATQPSRGLTPDEFAHRLERIRQCDNRCWGIEAALEECPRPRRLR